MWHRIASARLRELARSFPCVCILGARQVGKTTLAKGVFPAAVYFDMERPSDFDRLQADPEFHLSQAKSPVILDEAQRLPSLFPVLRGLIDRHRRLRGRFLLLGSVQPGLVRGVSESLAGRVGFLDLDPMTLPEVGRGPPAVSLDDLWLRGGFPEPLRRRRNVRFWDDWMSAYVRTFIERDLPGLGLGAQGPVLRRLWGMLCHAHGGIWNASEYGASLGINYHTVNRYVDILEGAFLVRRLPPFFRNLGKRLVKSPKVYIRDSGLLHWFLGIRDRRVLLEHPKCGASWEGFVIEELIRREKLRHPSSRFYFWRTATGQEVDLLIERAGRLSPIEIKLGLRVDARAVHRLQACMADLGASRAWIVTRAGKACELARGVETIPVQRLAAQGKDMLA